MQGVQDVQATFPAGFGLLELVVLMVTIFMLVALSLPLIDQAQEAARRNLCMNKMKQLALALQNHHDVTKRFPATSNQGLRDGIASVWWPLPGSGAATGATPSVGYTADAGTTAATAGYSWIVKILPYMDEAPVYKDISTASAKFTADAFTPFDVEANANGVKTGQPFCVTFTTNGVTISKHFAAIQFDQLQCPSFAGTATVAPSQYPASRARQPPAAYGNPIGSKLLGSPSQYATVSNYVAMAATHFSCSSSERSTNLPPRPPLRKRPMPDRTA